jgi:hypothetical protein
MAVCVPLSGAPKRHIQGPYPVLAIIALGRTLADEERPSGRLPKYNPRRRKTFTISDWAHVCRTTSKRLAVEGSPELAAWAEIAATKTKPRRATKINSTRAFASRRLYT